MRRKIFIAATVAALITSTVTPANAALWTGACALRITIAFRGPVTGPLDSASYDLDVAGLADFDLMRSGTQSCVATLSGEPTTGTWVSGSGFSGVWSCAAALGTGSWHQTFEPEGPGGFEGNHTLTGAWGAWTLEVNNPSLNVVGVGEFTLQALEATKTPNCALGEMDSVTMVGTLVFQDP